jgi:hypothetical protein
MADACDLAVDANDWLIHINRLSQNLECAAAIRRTGDTP